jgi:hypothetical protein
MAYIFICDGCLKHAPDNLYQHGWCMIQIRVEKGYGLSDWTTYTFHTCSQQCFNAIIRLKSVEIFE